MKKKLKLRGWVKVSLILIGLLAVLNMQYEKAVSDCIDNGHGSNYCVEGLK